MQKLYCYVDETGQDAISQFFIVVAVVSGDDQHILREQLIQIEKKAKTGHRKWHKSKSERRLSYLQQILSERICEDGVHFGYFQKPLPYFLPILEALETAIKSKAEKDYQTIVSIDGIDKKKAAELTNALRLRGVKLRFIRSARDESEPLIRLADMWAGCLRGAFLGKKEEKEIYEKALRRNYFLNKKISPAIPESQEQSLP